MATGFCECGCGKKTLKIKRNYQYLNLKKGEHRRFIMGHSGHKGESSNFRYSNLGNVKPDALSRDKKYLERYRKTYKQKNKEILKVKNNRLRLWKMYRLSPEELNEIDNFQSNHGTYKLLIGTKRLGTDHCHKTGLIRGRLDFRLNRAYGMIEKAFPSNTSDILRALAYYHEFPPAVIALGEKRYGLIGRAQYKKKMVYGPPQE